MYAAKQLEKYMAEDTLYSSKLVKIPVPRFVVFYNGTEKQPERRVLKLSDAYEKKVASPELELKVLMLNINQGNPPWSEPLLSLFLRIYVAITYKIQMPHNTHNHFLKENLFCYL